ncbi:DUF2332 domain-containing protein [Geobacillus thermodenitrificans]|uniref:DUF2332 domain-containing protein n=1 Tax=Geobacillus thermodenitrificans TaxID=33940 RepID=UPI000C28F501|nr:DUF2332 domain-containing protein [Geobacillus thermodenitrificans]PJW22025.1 DUF2332 domain-containing protein [Geobacillus thermodenitrificans]
MNFAWIAERFRRFAVHECRGSSPLYEHLSFHIAADEKLLCLASHARSGQPVPNLLFGAVHDLLLKGYEHELREFYGSIVKKPRPPATAFPYFRDFCLCYWEDLKDILAYRLVQTNEVRRCSYLYPVFCWIYEQVKKPLSLIEIGTSAGLQLVWDQYRYNYGQQGSYGNVYSDVLITSNIHGDRSPFLLLESPPVAERIGIDLHVIDLKKEDDRRWMEALIWPEHHDRRQLFAQAARRLEQMPVRLIEGDGVKLLAEIVVQVPSDTVVCIFHTHVANQMSEEAKHMLMEQIHEIGCQRDLFHVYNNMWDRKLHLDGMIDGREYRKIVAETDGHGRWFRWEMNISNWG